MSDQPRVRVDGASRTFVLASGDELPLPSPEALKREAMDWIRSRADEVGARAAELLFGCELDYEVVAGEDGAAGELGIVAVTDDERAWELSDEDDLKTWYVVSALHEACPDLQGFRAVARE